MTELSGPEVFVYLLPGLIPPGALRGGVAVVLDVLRATTVIVHALAAGCEAVIPCLEIEDAYRVAGGLPEGSALLAGERLGLPIEGFDLGNSPDEFTPEVCRGKTLVLTTTNGTRALLACQEAEQVFVAAFPNLGATLQVLHTEERPVHIVCAGTDGFISYEDALLAGAFAQHFKDLGGDLRNDEAEIVSVLWKKIEEAVWVKSGDRAMEKNPLTFYLVRGRGGRRVQELGLKNDIEAAAKINSLPHPLIAALVRDPVRVVAVRP